MINERGMIMLKKAISVLSIVMVICMCLMTPFTVNAKNIEITKTGATSGTTGDCTWSLDGTVLTISGNGKMADYQDSNSVPWDTESITSVIIKDGVHNVGNYAFCYGREITSVTLGESIEAIGKSAFYNCGNLPSITIPKSVTTIEYAAFGNCYDLKNVIIPDSVISIGSDAFRWCMSLEKVTIGNHVSSIGTQAFAYCSSLSTINIPDSTTTIGSASFYGCSSLSSIELPDSVISIGTTCFAQCDNLTSLRIPDSLSIIGRDFCSSCKSLESIIIPNSVTEINESAFNGCTLLKIYAYDDSYARTYAVQNSIPFVSLGAKSPATKKTGNNIYFDAASAGWINCGYVGFYICTDSGYQFSMWGSRNTYGDYIGNGVWKYDLDSHGITLDSSSRYTVIFYSDYGRTNELALDISCYGDTAYCDGTKSPNPADSSQLLLSPFWEHHKLYINILGDVDFDGEATILDATVIQRCLAEIPVVSYNEANADTDGDGSVTILDATSIQRYLAELPTNDNIGKAI
jgi:hypothetical protein